MDLLASTMTRPQADRKRSPGSTRNLSRAMACLQLLVEAIDHLQYRFLTAVRVEYAITAVGALRGVLQSIPDHDLDTGAAQDHRQ